MAELKEKLRKVLENRPENHIHPFFWQHGESQDVLLEELHRIYYNGIRGVCVEARGDDGFGTARWYDSMRCILRECRKLGMDFWLLDDRHFPTGQANGLLKEKYPQLGRRAVGEYHTDVLGPCKDAAVQGMCRLQPDETFLGAVACERILNDPDQRMTGRCIDLTANAENGLVFCDLPQGCWRVFILYTKPVGDEYGYAYVDTLREDSAHVLIEGVYEPHYRELGEFFGNTFRGFFSDEPFIMAEAKLPTGNECVPYRGVPWNDEVCRDLTAAYGADWLCALPALWFPMEGAQRIRTAYMDVVTKRYRQCFSMQLGDWCRAHGVIYTGHVVEDTGYHTQLRSTGHFFRSMDGQDIAGVDVVLDQIIPGMADMINAVPCSYQVADPDFFHFLLAKLGSSHAHIQPLKQGRAMCEVYGAYGWAEGLPTMKWLTDHMLVRGINEFVPHAYSPMYPDPDCPPYFYARGHNPEHRQFGLLMHYMNRMTTLLSGGVHHADCAMLYQAQGEWAGGRYLPAEKPARVLTEAQLDFDVIPEDALPDADVRGGRLYLNRESYACFIVPGADYLPAAVLRTLADWARQGLPVWFVETAPIGCCEGGALPEGTQAPKTVPLVSLAQKLRENGFAQLTAEGKNARWLRFYHTETGDEHFWMFFNENATEPVDVRLSFADMPSGTLLRYDAMANSAVIERADGTVTLQLPPYQSAVLYFGDVGGLPLSAPQPRPTQAVPQQLQWRISTAAPEAFDPELAQPQQIPFGEGRPIEKLYNLAREDAAFSGFVRYETTLRLPRDGSYLLDLGQVGETAYVLLDGKVIGEAIIPPYRFAFTEKAGEAALTVITTSHPGYRERDGFSAFLSMEPIGLQGPVTVWKTEQD